MIAVGARSSKLSRKQTEEVLEEICAFHPKLSFQLTLIESRGDKDLITPLSSMEKSDFFTKEIDELILEKKCRIAIHSAKDLPKNLPKGLTMIALTQGKTSCDSLVMPDGVHFHTLPKRAKIGSSSDRRTRMVHTLRPDLNCVEVRGKVDHRLALIKTGEIEGLVVAEAALIRLGYKNLNRMLLPGEGAPFQGQLSVIARSEDKEMETLFASIDTRVQKKILYTGISLKYFKKKALHCPMIQTTAIDFNAPKIVSALSDLSLYTHLIFTSKIGVHTFFDCLFYHQLPRQALNKKKIFAIGPVTAKELKKKGVENIEMPAEATQEGMVQMLSLLRIKEGYFLMPQSSQARGVLAHFLVRKQIRHQAIFLYETTPKVPDPVPCLREIGEIVFTSPSTVKSFFDFFKKIPDNIKLTAIGPITKNVLRDIMKVKV